MIDLRYVTHKRDVFFDISKAYLNNESKVLDIGAGAGAFIKYCKREDFYLFDGNEESINELKKLYKNCFLGTLPHLPFESGIFDLIHCSHVVEHLEPQVFYDTLKEMDRCLNKKGYLIISAPLMWENFYDDLSHIKPYNPNLFIKYLTKTKEINLTREKISESYEMVDLKYRYHEVCYTEYFTSVKNNLLSKLFLKLINLAYRCGIRRYIKSGYTIVLQKN